MIWDPRFQVFPSQNRGLINITNYLDFLRHILPKVLRSPIKINILTMTTREVMKYLSCTEKTVEKLGQEAMLRPGWAVHGGSETTATDWFDEDVVRYKILSDYGVTKDWTLGRKYDILYCRTEPNISDLPPASVRVDEQKERMLTWIQGRGMDVDLVIKEVRPVMRYREYGRTDNSEIDPSGLQTLLGMLSARKVRTLYIESRDRFNIGSSWFLIEDLCKTGKCEIVVMNSVFPTDEMRAEAKGWMTDVLMYYKMMNGELKDQAIIDTFMKGFDSKLTFKMMYKVDAKLTQVVKNKRIKRKMWEKLPAKMRILDLDDCWDNEDIYKSRARLGLPPEPTKVNPKKHKEDISMDDFSDLI